MLYQPENTFIEKISEHFFIVFCEILYNYILLYIIRSSKFSVFHINQIKTLSVLNNTLTNTSTNLCKFRQS